MSQTLSRWQSIILGFVVVAALGLSGFGLTQIASSQGLWADTFELETGFAEVNDVGPGTPVRIRGVNAGQVVAVEYPTTDGPTATVSVRMRLDARFRHRVYADGTVRVQSTGLLGSKVIAIDPGTPASGEPIDGRLGSEEAVDFAKTAAKLDDIADKLGDTVDETTLLVREVRTGDGTIPKLLRDDDLYAELKGLAKDTRVVMKRADGALTVVEVEAGNVRELVSDGRDTLRSVKQGTDAVQKLPIIRGYVEDQVALLSRPDCQREAMTYNALDLFPPGSAVLSEQGKEHLSAAVAWLKQGHDDADAVVVCRCGPDIPGQTAETAVELTRKQSEAVTAFLRENGAHKTGWFSRREITPIGVGHGPCPVPERESVSPSYLQLLMFTPQG